MKAKLFLVILGVLVYDYSLMAQVFKTETFSEKIKTLRVNVVDDWVAPPLIELEGGHSIEVNFDEMGEQPSQYVYTLTHCNSDWKSSSLSQSEFMSGFQYQFIEDHESSFNTTVNYNNYRIFFPNADLTMKVSGNYVVRVYLDEDRNHPVLSACFSVIEPQVSVQMQVSSKTDLGVNLSKQQLSFELNFPDQIHFPQQDLKTVVTQNNRRDNQVVQPSPLIVQYNKLIFDHNPKLIFDGGNEYRHFEMLTTKYEGYHVESIQRHDPYYHVTLEPDQVRANHSYSFDEDIDGRYLVRCLDGTDYDTETDYFIFHFFIPTEQPFPEDVYLLSEGFHNDLDEYSKMTYSAENKGYEKAVLLKGGYYNYLYVNGKNENPIGSPILIEGNHYQTENEYSVWVYYRPSGARYDRLIGFQTIQYK